jgi:hypothetical protein
MDDPERDVAKKLDEVVGERFDEGAKGVVARIRQNLAKWIAGALLAVGAVTAIVLTIESHRLPPENAPPPSKPVKIQIIPGR